MNLFIKDPYDSPHGNALAFEDYLWAAHEKGSAPPPSYPAVPTTILEVLPAERGPAMERWALMYWYANGRSYDDLRLARAAMAAYREFIRTRRGRRLRWTAASRNTSNDPA